MSNKKEKVTASAQVNSSVDLLANFEWGPYQVGTEDRRDIGPIVPRPTRKLPKSTKQPKEDFFDGFEWGPYQISS